MLKLKLSSGVDAFFSQPFMMASEYVCIGVSDDQKVIVKVEIHKHPGKMNNILQEANVLKHLNAQNCLSCPQFLGEGIIGKEVMLQIIDPTEKPFIEHSGKDQFLFNAQECIHPTGHYKFEDLFLTMLEQQKMGVFQGDIKDENIIFDAKTGICYLIDYDQAELLTDEERDMDSYSYLRWCDGRIADKYAEAHLTSFLGYYDIDFKDNFEHLFDNGSFNIGTTSAFRGQETTMSAGGIYHSFAFKNIFANGERNLDVRAPLLDKLTFAPGEQVLDVGCNAGLLSIYLHDRGCQVSGIDLDPKVITGAKYVANILGKDIQYHCLDLDKNEIIGSFDTVMLFSVIHHTQNIIQNARQIANSCNRIIIECRLNENGAKPIGDKWIETSKWNHPNLESLEQSLENMFPSFRVKQNLGIVDRDRYILELVKDNP